MQRKANLALALVSTTHGMNHFYQLLLPVALPLIRADYELTYLGAGLLLFCFSLSYSLFQTPVGLVSARVGRKNLLVMGLILTSLAFIVLNFTSSFYVVALVLFLAGIGGSTYHPNGMPLISELFENSRGQASGFHQTGGSLGSFISPLVAGLAMVSLGWRISLLIMSVPGLVLALILWIFLVDPRTKVTQEPRIQTPGTGLYGPVILLIVSAAIYTTAFRGMNAFANQYFVDARGITNLGEASFLFSMLQVAGLFSAPLTGRLSDRWGRRSVIIMLILGQSLSVFWLLFSPSGQMIFPCILFGFTAFGLLAISDAYLADITPRQHVETVFGVHFTVSFVTGAILPPILGSIIDSSGFAVGFSALAFLILAGIPLIARTRQRDS